MLHLIVSPNLQSRQVPPLRGCRRSGRDDVDFVGRFNRAASFFAALTLGSSAFAADTAAEGLYSEAQAERGATVYASHCVACHAPDMAGAPGSPPLTGRIFLIGWQGETVGALYDYLKTMMPTGAAGTLTDQQYADALALILQKNGFPASADGAEIAPDAATLGEVAIGQAP